MAEMGPTEVCAWRPVQVWRALVDWVAFLVHIIVQIARGTRVGLSALPRPSLLASFSSSSPSFKPLPNLELSLQDSDPCPHVSVDSCVGEENCEDDRGLERLTVVLDLDETLVCAYETSSLPATVRTQAMEAGLKWFEMQCISAYQDSEGKEKINYVTVFERPGLQEFLEQISEFGDLILFTAGLEGYAKPLVEKIDVKKRFCGSLYRPSTVSTEHREHVKDLSCLSKDLSRTVIVDNNPFSFLLQPLNGIPCVPFSASQPNDDQLLEVLLPLLKHLSLEKDVRPVLYERFHMPEWFQMHGVPVSG